MKRTCFGLIAVLAVAGAAVWYYSLDGQKSPQPPPQAALPEPPAVRHPIEPDKPTREPLPTLDESDGAMRDVLRGLFGKNFQNFFFLQDIIHRAVATIDNLPRDDVPLGLMPVKPVPGLFVTTGTGENLAVSPRNDARYRPYVRLAEAVPPTWKNCCRWWSAISR